MARGTGGLNMDCKSSKLPETTQAEKIKADYAQNMFKGLNSGEAAAFLDDIIGGRE